MREFPKNYKINLENSLKYFKDNLTFESKFI